MAAAAMAEGAPSHDEEGSSLQTEQMWEMWELFRLGWTEFLGDPLNSMRHLMHGMNPDDEGGEGLLPNGMPRSDEELGDVEGLDEQEEHRKEQLLRVALCCFCMAISVLIAAAVVRFMLAHHHSVHPSAPQLAFPS